MSFRRRKTLGICLSFICLLSFGWAKGSDRNTTDEIPSYVFEYAPLVHLFSGEQFWPCHIRDHLQHVTPHLNYTPLQSESSHLSLEKLDRLNQWEGGRFVYLQSNDNVEERPKWLGGEKNIPVLQKNKTGIKESDQQHPILDEQPIQGGRSDAPVVLLVIDKGNGIVDAFWFFFYSYNLGNLVFNIRFGNHVGDWEHTMVRFKHGKPTAIFLSAHSGGDAYTYRAIEKIGKRPVVYSATGTHAMYATPGIQSYVLPFGLLHDQTDRGPLWDPVLNMFTYTYDYLKDDLRASNYTPTAPRNWFYFRGRWGDKFYPSTDSRQYELVGQYHYVSGPLGPRYKRLFRRTVCQSRGVCLVRDELDTDSVRIWDGDGPLDDWPADRDEGGSDDEWPLDTEENL